LIKGVVWRAFWLFNGLISPLDLARLSLARLSLPLCRLLLPRFVGFIGGSARCRVIGFGITLADLDNFQIKESTMWTKPEYVDLRVGFEVTMYFSVR
jgi:coenzyme PQQ precursor peptide PqqA